MASPDLAVQDVIETLDSFYCHNVVVGLWTGAVANRLEGMALYLLGDELREVADHAHGAARRLADRIGDLAGAITADPRQLIDRAPGEGEFTIPDCSDPGRLSPMQCSASTSSSPPIRHSWTGFGRATT